MNDNIKERIGGVHHIFSGRIKLNNRNQELVQVYHTFNEKNWAGTQAIVSSWIPFTHLNQQEKNQFMEARLHPYSDKEIKEIISRKCSGVMKGIVEINLRKKSRDCLGNMEDFRKLYLEFYRAGKSTKDFMEETAMTQYEVESRRKECDLPKMGSLEQMMLIVNNN